MRRTSVLMAALAVLLTPLTVLGPSGSQAASPSTCVIQQAAYSGADAQVRVLQRAAKRSTIKLRHAERAVRRAEREHHGLAAAQRKRRHAAAVLHATRRQLRTARRDRSKALTALHGCTASSGGGSWTPRYDTVVPVRDGHGETNDVYVPSGGDGSPYALLLAFHGCGGDAAGMAWQAADYWGDHYVTVSAGDTDGGCWSTAPGSDHAVDAAGRHVGVDRVFDMIAWAEANLPIDQRRIVLLGYSSGGDLAYRFAFEHSQLVAGVLSINTAPFQVPGNADSGSGITQANGLAAVHHFHFFHVGHTGDTTYCRDACTTGVPGVHGMLAAMRAAGWPGTEADTERWLPGGHYEADDGIANDQSTDENIQQDLVEAHMDDGWTSP